MDTSSTGAKFSILLCILVGPTSTAGTKRTPEYSSPVLNFITPLHSFDFKVQNKQALCVNYVDITIIQL